MTAETRGLAEEMVRLDRLIRRAWDRHHFDEALDLLRDLVREHRSALLRDQWAVQGQRRRVSAA